MCLETFKVITVKSRLSKERTPISIGVSIVEEKGTSHYVSFRSSPRADFKGATSRYFESFSATCKITFSVRETKKY